MLLTFIVAVPAEESGTDHWFAGVERGTDTPEVVPAPPPDRRLRRTDRFEGELRLAQAQAPRQPVPPQGTMEALPMPGGAAPPDSPQGSRVEGKLPISGWDADVDIAQGANGRIDRLVVRDASLSKVLALLAQTYHLNIVAANDIDAVISITLRDVALEEALTAILSVANYTWVDRDGIILITSLSDSGQLSPEVQGRHAQIFELDFVSATVISEAVTNFLSPIGKMTVVESDPSDNRRTRDMIVVEDIPEAIARIAAYIDQVDCPPRQVLIEAHILQVRLHDEQTNGVNFDALARIAGARVNIKTVGFASAAATPAFLTTINGTDLDAVIQVLQETNDTKTLGSPKILVLNQQEAMVHVGEDLGYQTTVTSELQSTQAPQFLQTGVLLTITPRITRDNRILLHVRPEVSTGEIDQITQVPNKKTTELETDVMLNDGEGMVIGGLIDELDNTAQQKVPYLGDLWRVGFLFRKSTVTKERKEVIVALIPRIQPYDADYHNFEQGEWVRAATPLFKGPLCYVDRPYEPHLPDGKRVARTYIPPGAKLPEAYRGPCNYCEAPAPKYYVPSKPFPRERLVTGPTGEFGEGNFGDQNFVADGDGGDGCYHPGLSQPDAWSHPQPELGGEFVPDSGGYEALPEGSYDNGSHELGENSIISDQP
jgi:hypothetical protein